MLELYNSTETMARKDHCCEHCGKKIPKGFKYFYESGKYDGSMFTRKSHPECSEKWKKDNEDQHFDDDWSDFFDSDTEEERNKWLRMIEEKYGLEKEEFDD